MIFNDSRYPDLFLYGGFDFDLVRYGESFESVRVCEGGLGEIKVLSSAIRVRG